MVVGFLHQTRYLALDHYGMQLFLVVPSLIKTGIECNSNIRSVFIGYRDTIIVQHLTLWVKSYEKRGGGRGLFIDLRI